MMTRNLSIATVAALLLACSLSATAREKGEKMDEKKKAEKPTAKKVLRHVVLMKFKEGTTPEQIKKLEDGFRALPDKIDAIVDFEWGTDCSVEGLQDGFTHCFLVTFPCEKSRAKYLPHPDHLAFVKIVKPHLDKVLVIDYWTKQ